MNKVLQVLIVVFALGFSQVKAQQAKSRGAIMYSHPSEIEQPDGSTIVLKGSGDAVVHWLSTEQGYTVLKSEDNWYEYAMPNAKGNLIPSGIKVTAGQDSPAELGFFNKQNTDYRFSQQQVSQMKSNYFSGVDAKSPVKAFPTTGSRKVLLILASFSDKPNQLASSTFNNVMNQTNYNSTGSFRDFYLASSFNQLDLETTVTVWVQVSNTHAYYGGNNASGNDLRPREFVREAVDSLEAQGFDFSPFDNDGDGYVDGVQVIHAGYGEEYGGANENNIWSHRWSLGSNAVTYDGVTIYDYAIYPELRGTSGTNPSHIGVICHEFGHSLGLPDYYDTDYGESGGQSFDLGEWEIMAGGSWNNNGATPANHNAYSKSMLGWITLEELNSATQNKTLNNAMENAEACIINTNTANEFFVIENRQKTGFDSYIPHHGMLIFHVDRNYFGWNSNDINSDPSHQAMDIEEADNAPNSFSTSGDAFPGTSSVTKFSDQTNPGSLAWDGSLTNKPISNIVESGDVISFDFMWTFDATTPTNFVANALSSTEVSLSWNQDANANDVLLAYTTNNVFGTPINGATYSAGDVIPGGGQVILADSVESFSHSGLVANTTYYYQIWSNNGEEYSTPASKSVQLFPPGAYQISLQVVDSIDQPIANAFIDLGNDSTSYTDTEGYAIFMATNGVYYYQISKNGYDTLAGTILVSDKNYSEKIVIKETSYFVEFTVVDEDNEALNNVLITVDGTMQANTDTLGKAGFFLFAGSYNYTVALNEYQTIRESFNVVDTALSIEVTLLKNRYTLKFKVTDASDNNLIDALVELNNGMFKTTSTLGEAEFELLSGSYKYTLSKNKYDTVKRTIDLGKNDSLFIIKMQLTKYQVLMNISDSETDELLENVVVKLNNGETETTNASGQITFNLMPNVYTYTLIKDEFVNGAGEFIVSDTNKKLDRTMDALTYSLTVRIVDKDYVPIQGILVALNDFEPLVTNNNGESTFEYLRKGTYKYSATKIDYGEASDSIELLEDEFVMLQILQTGVTTRQQLGYVIYPNPSKGICFIKGAKGTEIKVIDATGKMVMQKKMTSETNELNLLDKTPGKYFIIISKEDSREQHSIIIE